jgi:hypothetical protein
MSVLESDGRVGAPARRGGSGWADRVLEVLLPQRGAIANARAAVESNRAAARQRELAALAMARAAGHPVAGSRRTAR